jgi:adenylate cyclase
VDVFVRTLHPEVIGWRFHWQQGTEVSVSLSTFDLLSTSQSRNSLVEYVCASGNTIRKRPTDDASASEFPLLKELWVDGVTEALASPLVFTTGDVHAAIWTTRHAGGLTDEQLTGIEAVVKPLARVAEVRALRRTAANLPEKTDFSVQPLCALCLCG